MGPETSLQFQQVYPGFPEFKLKLLDELIFPPESDTLSMTLPDFQEKVFKIMSLKFATWEIAHETEAQFNRAMILRFNNVINTLIRKVTLLEKDYLATREPEQLLGMGFSQETVDNKRANIPGIVEVLQDEVVQMKYANASGETTSKRVVDYKDGYKSIQAAMGATITNGIDEWLNNFNELFIQIYTDERVWK